MKRIIYSIALILILSGASGCKKWLDVNKNPNAPEVVAPNLYLGPLITNFVLNGTQSDGSRYIAKYNQNWSQITASDTYDRHGYTWGTGSLHGGELWRTVYFLMGYNLIDMMALSEQQERWDLLGIGYTLKAFGWLSLSNQHGEIILKQAFDLSRKTFDYDGEQDVYIEVQRLLDLAITNLSRTDGAVDQAYIGANDPFYGGNRVKWLKLAYGLKAIALNQLSNKGENYKPNDIIAAVDLALASNADDAKFKFTALASASANYLGPQRANITSFRQTNFFVNLLNGTQFSAVVDPRLTRLLFPSPDGKIYGVDPTFAASSVVAQRPATTLWGSSTSGIGLTGNYIFSDKGSFPMVTYPELQFIKAEAAIKKGDKVTALTAYRNGISAHIDFVNQANAEAGNTLVTQITPAEKAAFLASAAVPVNPADLKLSDVMSQKYIALWGWGFLETWTDLRRYHYMDTDPEDPTVKVFKGFTVPALDRLFTDNLGKPVYRMRPRYDSEFTWNVDALNKLGLKNIDYQTQPIWIAKP